MSGTLSRQSNEINISFKVTPTEHSLLIAISNSNDRSMASELRNCIKTRAQELGFLKEKQK